MGRKKDTGLTDDQAKALATELRRHLTRYDSQTDMAKAWGVSQSQLSQLISAAPKARGAGVAVLIRLRKHSGRTLDELLGLEPIAATPPEVRLRSAVEQAISDIEAMRKRALEPVSEPPRLPPGPAKARKD